MGKIKSIFSSWKVWVLIAFIVMAFIAIAPNPFASGVEITSVTSNSTAEINELEVGMVIESLGSDATDSVSDYSKAISKYSPGDIIEFNTDQGTFKVLATEQNNETYVGITVGPVKTSNLKKGLDLAGGVRALLKPVEDVDEQTLQDVILITEKRLNAYGISDISVRQVGDLEGNDYIQVEVPGANKEEVADLLQRQGKFEAKIGEEVIFRGGNDIKGICRTPDCSGIDVKAGCGKSGDQWSCRYQFRVDISPESAKHHAEATNKLDVITEDGQRYLSEKLDLYLDDELVSSLFISAELQGSESTSFVIQGPGVGVTKQDATVNAYDRMREMQTVLISGSLPVKLEVAKMDVISPTLGANFLQIAILALCMAILAVGLVVFIRYRKIKLAIPVILTGFAEVVIILGIAVLIKWRLDLAAIAGILAAVGTGVDDQIVIADEVLAGEQYASWKQRMKHAFFIIFAAYFTTVVAMLPLWWMGAGLVKGFAVTTIIGVTIGVFVTRPAFAKIIEVLLK